MEKNTSETEIKNDHGITIVNVKKSELNKNGYADFKTWVSLKDHVYIGRNMSFYVEGATESIWKNPYPVSKVAIPNKIYKHKKPQYTLDESLRLFKQHILSSPHLLSKLHELKGKTLGCWCKPNKCHGDVLIELVTEHLC